MITSVSVDSCAPIVMLTVQGYVAEDETAEVQLYISVDEAHRLASTIKDHAVLVAAGEVRTTTTVQFKTKANC